MMAKTATAPNSYLGNLRSGRFHELGPMGLTMETSVSPRPLLVILAERTGLIAKKSPPRLCWPSTYYGHVATVAWETLKGWRARPGRQFLRFARAPISGPRSVNCSY